MAPKHNRIFLKLRRAHLYVGLFLIPWALVYGLSALLFNHPTWFSETSRTTLQASSESWPDPDGLAESLTAAISSRDGVLLEAGSARWSPGLLRGKLAEQDARLRVDPGQGHLELTLRPSRPTQGVSLSPKLAQPQLQKELRRKELLLAESATRQGHEVSDLRFVRGPTLRFDATDSEGSRWELRYDLARERLVATSAPTELGWRSFLLRLHLAHGYPASLQARFAWAVFVDLMALALIFWCLSGLLMWFQMTRLRRAGLLCLAASLCSALPISIAMHASLR